jgi:hypothetical protein
MEYNKLKNYSQREKRGIPERGKVFPPFSRGKWGQSPLDK